MASERASSADLFSLHKEKKLPTGQIQVAAAPPGDVSLTSLQFCPCRTAPRRPTTSLKRLGFLATLNVGKIFACASAWSTSLAALGPMLRRLVTAPSSALVSRSCHPSSDDLLSTSQE